MLGCFLCGRCRSFTERSPDSHKYDFPSQQVECFTGVDGVILSTSHLHKSSLGADPNSIPTTEQHKDACSNFDMQEADGFEGAVPDNMRKVMLKILMQLDAGEDIDGKKLSSTQIPLDLAELDGHVANKVPHHRNACVNADGEVTCNALCRGEEIGVEEKVVNKEISAKEYGVARYDVSGKADLCGGRASKVKDVGFSAAKKVRLNKPKNSTQLFSYGICDQQRDFLFLCAGLVIQALGFQLKAIIEVVTIILLQGYRMYFFTLHSVELLSQTKSRVYGTYFKLHSQIFSGEYRKNLALYVKKAETIKPLLTAGAKRMGSVCIKAACFLSVLTALILISFICVYLVVMKGTFAQKQYHITKEIFFDFTKAHPVATLDVVSLNSYDGNGKLSKAGKVNNIASLRFRSSIDLTVPESDYNRNLGVFQVTSELLTESGDILSKTNYPCMLRFKSNVLRYMKSICLAFLLIAGTTAETQTLSMPSVEWWQGEAPLRHASTLRITLVPRAGRVNRDGLPELYKAEVHVDIDWVSLSASCSKIRTLIVSVGSIFVVCGFLSRFCINKIHHHREKVFKEGDVASM